MSQENLPIEKTIAKELKVKPEQVDSVLKMLDEGASIPFIARYRQGKTGGLDAKVLRQICFRRDYLRELDERRQVILEVIRASGHLTPALEERLKQADTKAQLEDFYLPYRPKRHSKAFLAKEAGLLPLAQGLLANPSLNPESYAEEFIRPDSGINDVKAALDGAREILMESFAEDASLLHEMREYLWQKASLKSIANKDKAGKKANKAKNQVAKFSDYHAYEEPIRKIPSHRALALFRGRREGLLQLSLHLDAEPDYGERRLCDYFKVENKERAADNFLMETVKLTWKLKLFPKFSLELLARLREAADEEAIRVFARNLNDLLLAPPAGSKITMGLDPGYRSGIKVAVIDEAGKVLDYTTIYPCSPQNEWHASIAELARLASRHEVSLISIGNGTGSREAERLVGEMMAMYPDLNLTKVLVSEAGASVYSASDLAAEECPEMDLSLRGAVSIARRLQDPLAELVKIEPKAIGVGQYQHDINQNRLLKSLDAIVEDCVNSVGVNLNTASVALLSKVSGLNKGLAKNLVQYRETQGLFKNRNQLKEVAKMGEKIFQQAAGFLRIMNGDNPLDASGVHPEAYPLVEKICQEGQRDLSQIITNQAYLRSVNASQFVDEEFDLATVKQVLKELERPGRDPRAEFKKVEFKEGLEDLSQLKIGLILDGVVTNVTNFGAFVDIGVGQDGLVHISAMTDKFISDPHSLVKAGDLIKVKVLEVDEKRRRISLTMKLEEKKPEESSKTAVKKVPSPVKKAQERKKPAIAKKLAAEPQKKGVFNTAMADALAKLRPRT